jgi:hypothetical protein
MLPKLFERNSLLLKLTIAGDGQVSRDWQSGHGVQTQPPVENSTSPFSPIGPS